MSCIPNGISVASKDVFELIVQNSKTSVFLISKTKIEFVNESTLALTGYKEAALLSKNFVDLVSPDERERVLTDFQKLKKMKP